MSDNIQKRLKQITTENKIWIIYLFIIFFSYYANKLETDYFLTGNLKAKNQYRKTNILIFSVLLIIYLYFEKGALDDYIKNPNDNYNKLLLAASSFVLLSGIIFLSVLIADKDLQTEIAFN